MDLIVFTFSACILFHYVIDANIIVLYVFYWLEVQKHFNITIQHNSNRKIYNLISRNHYHFSASKELCIFIQIYFFKGILKNTFTFTDSTDRQTDRLKPNNGLSGKG